MNLGVKNDEHTTVSYQLSLPGNWTNNRRFENTIPRIELFARLLCVTHTTICVKSNSPLQIMAAGKKTKIAVIVINVLEAVLQGVSIYYLHSARSPTLDNIPFWTEFGSANATLAHSTLPQFVINTTQSFATLFFIRIPWIILCLVLDFHEVTKNATDISVVVTFDAFAIYSMLMALSMTFACYRSLRRSYRRKEIGEIHFLKFKPYTWYSYTQFLCLNVVRYSMSKSIDRIWILSTICYVLVAVSNRITRLFVDWEAINDKKKGMTRDAVEFLVLSHIRKAMPSQEKTETVVAVDAVQPLTSQPSDAAQPLMSQPTDAAQPLMSEPTSQSND